MSSHRWKAVVKDGEIQREAEPYDGHDDNGCSEHLTTYGSAFHGIGNTPEEAVRLAMEGWERAQDPEDLGV